MRFTGSGFAASGSGRLGIGKSCHASLIVGERHAAWRPRERSRLHGLQRITHHVRADLAPSSPGTQANVTDRIRVGLFGAGLIGQAAHAPHLADDRERFEFVVVADPSKTVREAVAARHHVPHTAATLEAALELGLDAVVIAVPDGAHRDAVLTALGAGVHVLVEKPLAESVEDCDAILAARGDRVVQVGYMKLYDPAVERIVERLADGPAEIVYLSVETTDPDQGPSSITWARRRR